MEKLLLENLRISQAFDEILRRGTAFDRYAAEYLDQIMFDPNGRQRTKAIAAVEKKIINYFDAILSNDARTIGFSNANNVLQKLSASGIKTDLGDPKLRARVLNDLDARTEDRLRIMQRLVNDRANTLDNRLAAYWLEPGRDEEQKLARIRALHKENEVARFKYEKELADFTAGNRPNRPRKPNLDFISKFTEDVKQDNRVQARRIATDAETAQFQKVGVEVFGWVTVNASEACPDCKERQGETGDMKYWDARGRPGAGETVCGSACFCMLVPEETFTVSASLRQDGVKAA